MAGIGRRRFIQGSAATAALAALEAPLPAEAAAPHPAAKLADIDHIIVLMKENRSFDHYFGTLAGVRGFADRAALTLPDGRSVFEQPDALNPQGHVLPFRLDTKRTRAQRLHALSHEWGALHASWDGGKMDSWVPAHRATNGQDGPLTMGYLTREDLPFYHALADAFTICDGYHASVIGPTHPNRYYLWTATVDPEGRHGGPAIDNKIRPYDWETYPERLEAAGISWRIYHDLDDYNCNLCKYFTQYRGLPAGSPLREQALRNRPFYELLADLRSGNIPQVSWIVPPSTATEHPDYLPAAGEDHTRQVLEALWSNRRLWSRTLFILNYDENDGLFDHVAPPLPPPGTAEEYVGALPIGLGFRVPCLLISPFTRGGYVTSETFDHTSTLRLMEARFGVEVANLSRWRRETCGDFTRALGLGEAPRLEVPALPRTAEALRTAERNVMRLPPPEVPQKQAMPRQEPGTRRRRMAS